MLAVILGLVFIIAGGWGVLAWRSDFFVVLKGLLPVMLVVGGLISVVAGATNIAESNESKPSGERPPEESKEK